MEPIDLGSKIWVGFWSAMDIEPEPAPLVFQEPEASAKIASAQDVFGAPLISELPGDVLARVFLWLDTFTLLTAVPAVCSTWRKVRALMTVSVAVLSSSLLREMAPRTVHSRVCFSPRTTRLQNVTLTLNPYTGRFAPARRPESDGQSAIVFVGTFSLLAWANTFIRHTVVPAVWQAWSKVRSLVLVSCTPHCLGLRGAWRRVLERKKRDLSVSGVTNNRCL